MDEYAWCPRHRLNRQGKRTLFIAQPSFNRTHSRNSRDAPTKCSSSVFFRAQACALGRVGRLPSAYTAISEPGKEQQRDTNFRDHHAEDEASPSRKTSTGVGMLGTSGDVCLRRLVLLWPWLLVVALFRRGRGTSIRPIGYLPPISRLLLKRRSRKNMYVSAGKVGGEGPNA